MFVKSKIVTVKPPIAPATSFRPGDVVSVFVKLSNPADYTFLKLTLVGKTVAPLMLAARTQLNGTGGAGGLLESAEHAPFLELDFERVKPYYTSFDEKKENIVPGEGEEATFGGAYEIRIPEAAEGQLMPSFSPKIQMNGGTPMEIKYYVRLDGTRRQMFRLKDKIKVPLPVSYPSLEVSSCDLTATNTGLLKFVGANNKKPRIEATLTYQPLNVTGDVLRMRLVANIVDSTSGFAALSSTPIIPRAIISRQLFSRPRSNTSGNRGFVFDGCVFAATILKPVAEATSDGSLAWEGEIKVKTEEHTVVCDWMKIFYSLVCHIQCAGFEHELRIRCPIFIPSVESAAFEAPLVTLGGSDLPQYEMGA
ncbi:hypothetical protein P7C70_g1713, partial [Phenoliferia sp. Uapishka_3]